MRHKLLPTRLEGASPDFGTVLSVLELIYLILGILDLSLPLLRRVMRFQLSEQPSRASLQLPVHAVSLSTRILEAQELSPQR